MIEPYMPNRFARQFGYDQLYIEILHFSGNLFEGAQAWYFNVAGGTGARLSLPPRIPNSYATFAFCTWYVITNTTPGYMINNSCIREIKSLYYSRVDSTNTRLKGMSEFLEPRVRLTERKQLMSRSIAAKKLRSILQDDHTKL